MQVVDHVLNGFPSSAGSSRESEDAKMLIPTHHVAYHAAVGVVATSAMCLVNDQASDISGVESSFGEIVLEGLRRAVDDPLGGPSNVAKLGRRLTRELHAVLLRDASDVMAGSDLLSN